MRVKGLMIKEALESFLDEFFLRPALARPLGVLRIGLALVLLAQAFALRNSVLDFLARNGIIQGELSGYFSMPQAPHLSAWVSALSAFNLSETAIIYGVCLIYCLSLVLLGLGLWSRLSALVAWFLNWMLVNSSNASSYGVDLYAHVFLFYLIWIPAGDSLSLDVAWGRRSDKPTWQARLGLRLVQLHLCISYLCSGVEKARGEQWWNGELLWRALSLPVYRQYDLSWLAYWPQLSKLGGWITLIFEVGYFIFIWPRLTRRIWIAGIVLLHAGIAVFLGLELFGAVMCMLTLAAFGVSCEVNQTLN